MKITFTLLRGIGYGTAAAVTMCTVKVGQLELPDLLAVEEDL